MILSKNDEVIDFLTSPPTDFSALKNVQAEMLFNFQKPVTRLLPMSHNDVLISSKLFCL